MAGTKLTFEVLSIDPDPTPHTPHLILPMEVDGEILCPLYQGGRMTTAKVTNFVHANPSDNSASIPFPEGPWTGAERPGLDESVGDNGEFSFAVPCGGTLNCKYVYSDEAAAANGDVGASSLILSVYVNKNLQISFWVYGEETTHSAEGYFPIGLTCRPCGNLITIETNIYEYPG